MERPYVNESSDRIRRLIVGAWDDFEKLGALAYEIQFRRLISEDLRAGVVQRLVELGKERQGEEAREPDFEFPSTDVQEARRRGRSRLGDVDWKESGLLSLSGYRVGEARGVPKDRRRKVLNYVFLKDDLGDVDDPEYAASWGDPKSSARLQKLSETLAAFVRTAKRNPANMSRAIADWEEDLEYLKTTFYDNWGGFPWPDVEIY